MSSVSSPRPRHLPTETIVKAELFKVTIDGSFMNVSAGVVGTILVTLIFALLDANSERSPAVWVWGGVMLLVMLHGYWIAIQASSVRRDIRRLQRYGVMHVFYGGYAAAAFGATSWVLLPVESPAAESFLILSMAMFVMGGAGNQAAHWGTLVAFTLCFATVFSAGLARLGDRYHVAMAITFSVYALAALMFARNQQIAVRRQVLANLENQSLRAVAEAERARANSASEAKTTFLAAASHDLRQPLHALVQYSAHLSRISHHPEVDETVRRIGASVDAMRDLLDSILDLSKLMVGGVQPIVTAFPLDSVLERLDVQLQPVAASKGLQFIKARSDALVMSDDVLLERILRNLILNAIRYTGSGHVTVRCRQRRNAVQIQVWDSGIGIPRADLQRIFDPFFQGDNRARDRRKGLGLGLAIVRQLADLLGYRVKVKTKVGKGTVFAVSVPLCTDPAMLLPVRQASDDESVGDFVRGAFTVLVDDDKHSRDASEYTLKSFGCRIIAAASAAEAIEQLELQEFAPQIIVADYRLEVGTGIEAIHALTKNLRSSFGETFSIPALVLSGDTAPDELRRVNEHGFPMLHKPVATEDLWSALNRLLEHKAREMEF
jgi:signal transduction histidine kinase/CheY-like chemotaxis protein